MPWIRKYIPKNLSEVIGQDDATGQMLDFAENFKKKKKKAMFLYGPSGNGKTVSVHALAKQLNLEIIEVNASDVRNKEQIKLMLGGATEQMSLFAHGKIILVDEIDGLSGTKDRGGIPAIVDIIKKTSFPIFMTVQNPYDKKFSKLRNASTLVQFYPLSHKHVAEALNRICISEGISTEQSNLITLGRRSAGDMRAAINDLQTIYARSGELTREAIDQLGERNQTSTIIDGLVKIFKSSDPKIAITALDDVNEDLNESMLWIDENLPKEYENPEDLARAYDMLSKADIFNSRIRRWQHWRFLVYVNALITAGVAVSKDDKYNKRVDYKPTGRILKMWWAKQKNMKKKAIAEKIASATHTSSKQMIKNIEFFRVIFKNDKKMADSISQQLDLDKDEISWLKK